ncbi:unnamed protein product, partial [Amoebophrya sp. A25]
VTWFLVTLCVVLLNGVDLDGGDPPSSRGTPVDAVDQARSLLTDFFDNIFGSVEKSLLITVL